MFDSSWVLSLIFVGIVSSTCGLGVPYRHRLGVRRFLFEFASSWIGFGLVGLVGLKGVRGRGEDEFFSNHW